MERPPRRFGTVTRGIDGTVARIMEAGTADQGVTAEIVIERVDIIES